MIKSHLPSEAQTCVQKYLAAAGVSLTWKENSLQEQEPKRKRYPMHSNTAVKIRV